LQSFPKLCRIILICYLHQNFIKKMGRRTEEDIIMFDNIK
jgi:hypothetical protein